MWVLELLGIFLVVAVGSFLVLYAIDKWKGPAVWRNELSRASRDFAPRPAEERILAVLHIEQRCKRTPMEFSQLRSMSMLGDDMEFWVILKELERQEKVLRVADPTATSDSLWELCPPTEEEQAEIVALEERIVAYMERSMFDAISIRGLLEVLEIDDALFYTAFHNLANQGRIECVRKRESFDDHDTIALWALREEEKQWKL